jgi:hypothetical protein
VIGQQSHQKSTIRDEKAHVPGGGSANMSAVILVLTTMVVRWWNPYSSTSGEHLGKSASKKVPVIGQLLIKKKHDT